MSPRPVDSYPLLGYSLVADDREGHRDRRHDRRRGAREGARDVRGRPAARRADDLHGELPRPGQPLAADHPLRGRQAALDRRPRSAEAGSALPLLEFRRRGRPARPRAPARRVRRRSSLRNMLRRCVSTVFWLRNSAAAISGFVLRSTTRRASSSSRCGERLDAGPVRLAGLRAPVRAVAELSQLALGLEAVANGTGRIRAPRRRSRARPRRDRAHRPGPARGRPAFATTAASTAAPASSKEAADASACSAAAAWSPESSVSECRGAIGPRGRCAKARRLRDGARARRLRARPRRAGRATASSASAARGTSHATRRERAASLRLHQRRRTGPRPDSGFPLSMRAIARRTPVYIETKLSLEPAASGRRSPRPPRRRDPPHPAELRRTHD